MLLNDYNIRECCIKYLKKSHVLLKIKSIEFSSMACGIAKDCNILIQKGLKCLRAPTLRLRQEKHLHISFVLGKLRFSPAKSCIIKYVFYPLIYRAILPRRFPARKRFV